MYVRVARTSFVTQLKLKLRLPFKVSGFVLIDTLDDGVGVYIIFVLVTPISPSY